MFIYSKFVENKLGLILEVKDYKNKHALILKINFQIKKLKNDINNLNKKFTNLSLKKDNVNHFVNLLNKSGLNIEYLSQNLNNINDNDILEFTFIGSFNQILKLLNIIYIFKEPIIINKFFISRLKDNEVKVDGNCIFKKSL